MDNVTPSQPGGGSTATAPDEQATVAVGDAGRRLRSHPSAKRPESRQRPRRRGGLPVWLLAGALVLLVALGAGTHRAFVAKKG
ncbi:MAG: hypothetical protein ACYDAD_13700 [Acidimicrobiales bacterium]